MDTNKRGKSTKTRTEMSNAHNCGALVARRKQPGSSSATMPPEEEITEIATCGRAHGAIIDLEAANLLMEIPGLVNRKRPISSSFLIARAVAPCEQIYEYILKYINNSQVHGFGIQVLNILSILRAEDRGYQNNHAWCNKTRMLLWHGTKEDTLASILLNGFRLPEPNEQMFGPGIYFADRASKSANYCESHLPRVNTYLLLCDVLVGHAYPAKVANHHLMQPPVNFDSVLGVGCNYAEPMETVNYNGSDIPLGKTKRVHHSVRSSCPVQFNEYVVYHPEKVVPLYLVKFQYNPKQVLNVG